MKIFISLIMSSLVALPVMGQDSQTSQVERQSLFPEIVRKADGSVARMSDQEAYYHCLSLNAHLPTVRELALYAQSLGAAGIAAERLDNSYGFINAKNADRYRQDDDFYYSNEGYQRPNGELGDISFWSSSENPLELTRFYLDGVTGKIDNHFFGHRAAWCIPGPVPSN